MRRALCVCLAVALVAASCTSNDNTSQRAPDDTSQQTPDAAEETGQTSEDTPGPSDESAWASATAGGDACVELWTIPCEYQTARVRIPIPGTIWALHYASDRVPGRQAAPTADIGPASFGGWTLDVQQVYVPETEVLLIGDGRRRTVPAIEEDGELIVAEQDGSAIYVFDETGQHLRTHDGFNGAEIVTIDHFDNGRLSSVESSTGPNVSVNQRSDGWDLLVEGQVVANLRLDGNGMLAAVVNLVSSETHTFSYNDGGLLAEWDEPLGDTTTYRYDEEGRLLSSVHDGVTTEYRREGEEVTITRDGKPVATISAPLDDEVGSWWWVDALGGLTTEEVAADGTRTMMSPHDTTITVQTAGDPRFSSQVPYAERATFEEPGQPPYVLSVSREFEGSVVQPDSWSWSLENGEGLTESVLWDAGQNELSYITPEARVFVTAFDAAGRKVRQTAPGVPVTNFEYDDKGRLVGTKRGDEVVSVEWDGPLAKLEYAGQTSNVMFGPDGTITSITDNAGREFSQDSGGRVTRTTLDGELVTSTTRDDGRVTFTLPSADSGMRTFSFEATPWGVPRAFGWEGGDEVTFTSDDEGRVASLADGNLLIEVSYDGSDPNPSRLSAGDIVLELDDGQQGGVWTGVAPDPLAVDFSYAANSLPSQVSIGQTDIDFTFDGDGLLTSAGPLEFSLDGETGRVTRRKVGEVSVQQEYDSSGRMQRMVVQAGDDLIYELNLGFSGGRVVTRDEIVDTEQVTTTYGYDDAGRLASFVRNGDQTTYSWDVRNNLVEAEDPSGTTTITINEADQVIEVDGTTYSFDANQALAQRSDGARYTQTPSGKLQAVQLPDGRVVEYELDGNQRRVSRSVDGAVTDYFTWYDQLRPAAQYAADGSLKAIFIYDQAGHLAAIRKDGHDYAVITDRAGSPLLIVDSETGEIAQELAYDPFGRVVRDTNPGFQPFGFLGGLADPDTGLVNLGARDYDPALGRFISPDPIVSQGSPLNLYSYADGDPVNRQDRTGLHTVYTTYTPAMSGREWDILNTGLLGADISAGLLGLVPKLNVAVGIVGGGALGPLAATLGAFSTIDAWQDGQRNGWSLPRTSALIGGIAGTLGGALASVAAVVVVGLALGAITSTTLLPLLASALVVVGLIGALATLCGLVCPESKIPVPHEHGDPHTQTSDGTTFSYQGVGEFWAARDGTGRFGLQVRRESLGYSSVSYTTAIAVQLGRDTAAVYAAEGRLEQPVTINGERTSLERREIRDLPGGGKVARFADGAYFLVDPTGATGVLAHLRGGSMRVELHSTPEVLPTLVGLWGTADGNPENDWTKPDGTLVDMAQDEGYWERLHRDFGPSWRVPVDELLFDGEPETVWDPAFPPEPVTVDSLSDDVRADAEQTCDMAGVHEEPYLSQCILDVGLTGDPSFAADAAELAALDRTTATLQSPGATNSEDADGPTVNAVSWVTQLDGLEIRKPGEIDDRAGHVLVHAADEDEGVLVALDADDGSETWRAIGIEPNCPALPLGAGRIAVVGANDGPLGIEGRPSRTLVVLDANTGDVIAGPVAPDTDGGEPSFEPCRYTNTTADGFALYSDSLTGKVWAWDVGGEEPVLAWWRDRRPAVHNLVAVDDTVVLAAEAEDGDGLETVLLDLTTGEVLDSVDLPGGLFETGPTTIVLSGSTAVFATVDDEDDDIVWRLIGVHVDGTDLSLRWVTEVRRSDDSEAELPGRLDSLTAVGDVIVGHYSGMLVGVRVEDGEQAWVYDPPLFRNTDMPAVAGPDGVLYDGTFGGPFLFAVSAEGEPLWDLAHEDLFGEGSSVGPALTFGPVLNDRVIVGTVAPGDTPVVVAVSLSEDAGAAGAALFDNTFGR